MSQCFVICQYIYIYIYQNYPSCSVAEKPASGRFVVGTAYYINKHQILTNHTKVSIAGGGKKFTKAVVVWRVGQQEAEKNKTRFSSPL